MLVISKSEKTRLGELFKWGAPIQFENSSFSYPYIKINSASTALYLSLFYYEHV